MAPFDRIKPKFRDWYAVEALPIWIIIGTVGGLAALSIVRAVHAPSVQWTKDNPTPWNRIKQDEGIKLLQVNQTFDKKWRRDEY